MGRDESTQESRILNLRFPGGGALWVIGRIIGAWPTTGREWQGWKRLISLLFLHKQFLMGTTHRSIMHTSGKLEGKGEECADGRMNVRITIFSYILSHNLSTLILCTLIGIDLILIWLVK